MSRPLFDKCPGNISNRELTDFLFTDGATLKEDLIEHHDYEAVLPKVWDYMVSWYNFIDRQPILRPVRYDRKKKRHYIDLYLENNQTEATVLTDSILDDEYQA